MSIRLRSPEAGTVALTRLRVERAVAEDMGQEAVVQQGMPLPFGARAGSLLQAKMLLTLPALGRRMVIGDGAWDPAQQQWVHQS